MIKKYLLFLPAIIICACNQTVHEDFAAKSDSFFSKEFKENEPGAAIIVIKDGKILFEKSYGIADIVTREKITSETLFNLGSISKTFVSNGILMLARDGKLSLNDSIYKYFDDFKNKDLAKKVRIWHLLTHTSGLIDSRKVSKDSVFYLSAKDEENFYPIKQNDSLAFNPGEKFEYSNPAFNGLALIIEKIAKTKWQVFIKSKIFDPAKMSRSTITDGPYPQDSVSHGYILINKKFIEKDYNEEPTFAAAGNGGVWSSVNDMVKYEDAIRKAIFLPKETIERSQEITMPSNWKDTVPPKIGYSWFIWKDKDVKFVGHAGSQGGFVSDFVSVPEKKLLYICLCNTPKPIEKYRKKVFQLLNEFKLF